MTADPDPTGATTAAPGPGVGRWLRLTRRRLVAAGVVAVLVISGLGVLAVLQPDPEDVVGEYLAALTGGDYDRAIALSGAAGSSPLLEPGTLTNGYTPPSDVDIIGVDAAPALAGETTRRERRDAAYVRVRYHLGGVEHESLVWVQREPGGLIRDWTIRGGATGHLQVVTGHLSAVWVAAVEVPGTDPEGLVDGAADAVEVLPGVYSLSAGGDDPLFTGGPVNVAVPAALPDAAEPVPGELELAVRDEATRAVEDQIHAHLDDCAARGDLRPNGCPLRLEGVIVYPTPIDVQWTITAYPEVELRLADDPVLDGGPVTVHTTTSGTATVTYTDNGQPVTTEVGVEVGGAVGVDDDGQVTWTR